MSEATQPSTIGIRRRLASLALPLALFLIALWLLAAAFGTLTVNLFNSQFREYPPTNYQYVIPLDGGDPELSNVVGSPEAATEQLRVTFVARRLDIPERVLHGSLEFSIGSDLYHSLIDTHTGEHIFDTYSGQPYVSGQPYLEGQDYLKDAYRNVSLTAVAYQPGTTAVYFPLPLLCVPSCVSNKVEQPNDVGSTNQYANNFDLELTGDDRAYPDDKYRGSATFAFYLPPGIGFVPPHIAGDLPPNRVWAGVVLGSGLEAMDMYYSPGPPIDLRDLGADREGQFKVLIARPARTTGLINIILLAPILLAIVCADITRRLRKTQSELFAAALFPLAAMFLTVLPLRFVLVPSVITDFTTLDNILVAETMGLLAVFVGSYALRYGRGGAE